MKQGLLGFGADVVRAKALGAKAERAKFKPKSTRKMLFRPKGTCNLQKVTDPLAPTATMDVCQIQAKGYEENVVRAKGYVPFTKSRVPLGLNWMFDKFKSKSTRKRLFGPKGTCNLQKIT